MNLDVIVPTNNIKEINEFLVSYFSMTTFSEYNNLIVIGNGKVTIDTIENRHIGKFNFIRSEIDIDYIIPFLELRSLGMINSKCDYFMFLDDDHRFDIRSDKFLIKCKNLLINSNISILCTDRERDELNGLILKEDGFIWTNRGLFIRNTFSNKEIEILNNLKGAGEDILFSYLVLRKEGLPFTFYGSPITRKEKRNINEKIIKNKSYDQKVLNDNIIGFIREIFNDKVWNQESKYFPNKLRSIISKRIKDENISNSSI